MRSNEDIVEGMTDKRRANSETGGILLQATREQIPIQIATEPPPINPLSFQHFNPVGYRIPGDPPVPPLQDSSSQSWSYGPPFPLIRQQGDFPNFRGGIFPSAPAWPGLNPQSNPIYQQQQYSVPSNGCGSNAVGPSQNLILSPPGQVDMISYPTCL